MIRMRDDDVLVPSSSWKDVFGRFRQVHAWIVDCPQMIHVPTLITEELSDFPECVEYIKFETRLGRMAPELHGALHVDYAKLHEFHVREHLDESIEWMEKNVERRPEVWYTPWGAKNEMLEHIAGEFGLRIVGSDSEYKAGKWAARLREGRADVAALPSEMEFHWWEGGARILRLCRAVSAGSWHEAAQADTDLFGE